MDTTEFNGADQAVADRPPCDSAAGVSAYQQAMIAHQVQPGSKRVGLAGHVFKWLGAACGVFLLVIFVQIATGLVGGIAIGVINGLGLNGGKDATGEVMEWLMIAMQLSLFAVAFPWWHYVRKRSFLRARQIASDGSSRKGSIALRVVGIVFIGVCLQVFISVMLTLWFALFPEVGNEYNEMMSDAGFDVLSVMSLVTTVLGAPIVEEIALRGLTLEFALRAFSRASHALWELPRRRVAHGDAAAAAAERAEFAAVSRDVRMTPEAFWFANVVQALLFGVLHMNLVQGTYAFFIGMVLGVVVWKTGKLRYSMLLHLTLNLSSFFLGVFDFVSTAPEYVMLTLVIALVGLAGAVMFAYGCPVDERDLESA